MLIIESSLYRCRHFRLDGDNTDQLAAGRLTGHDVETASTEPAEDLVQLCDHLFALEGHPENRKKAVRFAQSAEQ